MPVLIYIDTYRCNGCGSCVELAPAVFIIDEVTEYPGLISDEMEITEELERAVAMCPTQCIDIEEG
jgi:ferredoxin